MLTNHIPVLLESVLTALLPPEHPAPVERIIDGTLGAGGHTRALLDAGAEAALGLDVDPAALALARENLVDYGERAHIVHANYVHMADEAQRLGWEGVDAILLDLGLSSIQLDTPERGFAFRHDAPLDMRFNAQGERPTAAELVNSLEEAQLAEIFYKYGEERHSRRIARAVVRERPVETTGQLAAIIEKATPHPKRSDKRAVHPATRVFQALRIAVNCELEAIEKVLPVAINMLFPGGRLAVISFHSLEDRIVKQVFREACTAVESPPGMASLEGRSAQVKLVNRKPITATEAEIVRNPRSRSAKLRVVEKLK